MAAGKDKPDEGAAGPETSLSPINKGECWEVLERLGLNTPRANPLEEIGRAHEKIGVSLVSDASDAKERAASATATLGRALPQVEMDWASGRNSRLAPKGGERWYTAPLHDFVADMARRCVAQKPSLSDWETAAHEFCEEQRWEQDRVEFYLSERNNNKTGTTQTVIVAQLAGEHGEPLKKKVRQQNLWASGGSGSLPST
jgi:hypothetical protein